MSIFAVLLVMNSSFTAHSLLNAVRTDFYHFQKDNSSSLYDKDLMHNTGLRSRYLLRSYQQYLSKYQNKILIKKMPSKGIDMLWHAALEVYSVSNNQAALNDAALDARELEHRGKQSKLISYHMFKSYTQQRNFIKANNLMSSQKLKMKKLPEISLGKNLSVDKPAIMKPSETHNVVYVKNVKLINYDVVVVATPQCHFVTRAIKAIHNNKKLHDVFKHSLWIMPQDGNYDQRSILRWNESHNIMKMYPVYKENVWPMVSYWGTPTFYFLHDGKVVRRVVGWPSRGSKNALISAFNYIQKIK